MFPPGSEPDEQRKEDGFRSRLRQSNDVLWWRTLNQVKTPNKGSPLEMGERKRDNSIDMEKGVYPSLYRPRGWVLSSSPPPCGTKPTRGEVRRPRGGWAPPLAPSPRGEPPPP